MMLTRAIPTKIMTKMAMITIMKTKKIVIIIIRSDHTTLKHLSFEKKKYESLYKGIV